MSKKQVAVLIVGLLLVALCAFFPPRRYLPTQTANDFSITHNLPGRTVTILSPEIYFGGYVCIDAPRLFAECLVIGALTGTVFLLMRPGRRQSSS